jgi:hypothetical protein
MLCRHFQGFYKLCNLREQENVGAPICPRLLYIGTLQYVVLLLVAIHAVSFVILLFFYFSHYLKILETYLMPKTRKYNFQ